MVALTFVFSIFVLESFSESARILSVLPSPSVSHQIFYNRYLFELHQRGHDLTVVTPYPIDNGNLSNYRQIDFSNVMKYWHSLFNGSSDSSAGIRLFPELFLIFLLQPLETMCKMFLSHPEMREMIEKDEKFDLFIIEWDTFNCLLPFMRQANNISIGITSFSLGSWSHFNLGSTSNPTYITEIGLPYGDRMTFVERLRNTILYANVFLYMLFLNANLQRLCQEYFGPDVPSIADLGKEVGVVLTNYYSSVQLPRPLTTNVIQVGGPAFHLAGHKLKPMPQTDGIRILAILPTPSISHHVFYNRYLLELHRRGHDITVATPYPVNDTNLKNYRQIDFSHFKSYWNKALKGKFESENVQKSIFKTALMVSDILLKMYDVYNSHPEIRDIVEKGELFDLFVTEWSMVNPFYPYMKHGNYSIGITSFALEPLNHYTMGSTSSPAYVPNTQGSYSDRMTLLERFSNTCGYIIFFVFTFCINLIFDSKNREYFGPDVQSLFTLEKKVSLILTNYHSATQTPRPFAGNIIPIGGPPFHLEGYDPLPPPQDLQRFLDDAKEGVIYFSLGSNVKSNAMPECKREIFLRAFSRIKEKVLWKWEADVLPGKPDNVKTAKWLPQTDILAHPNVKAFITQGGLQSVSEAVYFTVPMIVIPFFADQELNSKKLVSEGVGIRMEYENLEMDSFLAALHEITTDPGYKERMVKYSALTQDQPQSPLERAVWWTEYVIRHKGAKHLRSAAVDMPWYQYFLLDVFAFILAVLFITFYTFYKISSFIFRLLFGKNKTKKD